MNEGNFLLFLVCLLVFVPLSWKMLPYYYFFYYQKQFSGFFNLQSSRLYYIIILHNYGVSLLIFGLGHLYPWSGRKLAYNFSSSLYHLWFWYKSSSVLQKIICKVFPMFLFFVRIFIILVVFLSKIIGSIHREAILACNFLCRNIYFLKFYWNVIYIS